MVDTLLRSALHFLHPLSLAWLLLTLWTIHQAWRRRWRRLILPGTAWMLFSLTLCTALPSSLMRRLESPWLNVKIDSLPTSDAIVCLGGGTEPSVLEPAGIHLKDAGDRLLTAHTLFQQSKAPNLIFGGGTVKRGGQKLAESEGARNWELKNAPGTADKNIIALEPCAHTRDEAVKTAAIAKEKGWKQIILVTSAYHMSRAKATFEKVGLTVIAAPCNFTSHRLRDDEIDWFHLPGLAGPQVLSFWLHEEIGLLVYRWRDWL